MWEDPINQALDPNNFLINYRKRSTGPLFRPSAILSQQETAAL